MSIDEIPAGTWEATAAWLRQLARARVPASDIDDVANDVLLALLEHVAAHRPFRSWWGLAAAMLRTRAGRQRRGRGRDLRANEALDATPCREVSEPATGPDGPVWLDVRNLRGKRQREIALRVQAGETCVAIAQTLGLTMKQVRRVVRRLVTRVLGKLSLCQRSPRGSFSMEADHVEPERSGHMRPQTTGPNQELRC